MILLAAFLALPSAAERVSSEDGKFAIEISVPWGLVSGARGRSIELKAREENRLVVAGEWRDGSAPPPSAAQQARLMGAETANSQREGKLPLRYARRPSRRFNRVQGWLSCGGDRYLFDALVQRDEWLWSVLETFTCKEAAVAQGLDVGETGWKISIPTGFKQIGKSADGRGLWVRDETREVPSGGGIATVGWKETLRVMLGTEIWALSRPWPGTCKFADSGSFAAETPKMSEHLGKKSFLYSCLSKGAPPESASLAYDLIVDYDAEMGQATFISLRLFREAYDPRDQRPDRALFTRIAGSLRLSRPERTREAQPPAPAAVPLFR